MIVENVCMKYKGEIIKMFCVDYKEVCCIICVSFEYRKCNNVDSIDKCFIEF